MRTTFVLFPLVLTGLGCSPASQQAGACGAGRTMLDGVCVKESVADYVSCVRAQGAQLGQDRSQKLSAEAGFAGAKAGAASDVKDTLEKKYSASDANTLEIIHACNTAAGMNGHATANSPASPASSEKGNGRRAPSARPRGGADCACVNWRDVGFSVHEGGKDVCTNGPSCAARYGLESNECADPTDEGYPWCYTTEKCTTATVSAGSGKRWVKCD